MSLRGRAIFGIRVSMLFHLYLRRLRLHTSQELLAGMGIAVGVALVFGVLLANTSILGATEDTVHGVVGSARLELAARSSQGFDEGLAERVRRLPGVQAAAPALQESAALVGPKGLMPVEIVGVTPSVVTLGGSITQGSGVGPSLIAAGLGLPTAVAHAIGARPEHEVTVLADGLSHRFDVTAVVGAETLGAAAESPIAVTLMSGAQRLTGRQGRVTQVFVQPVAGQDKMVEGELRRLAAGRLNVAPADQELRLLRAIAKPSGQATTMFALIGAIVGFLFTFNAMLLTVPERRRYIADMRMQGYDRRQMVLILGFEAAVLGVVASAAGVVLGYVLSRALFHSIPLYLAFAFPIGNQQPIPVVLVVLALTCGTLATVMASLVPAIDLRRGRPRDAVIRGSEGAAEGIGSKATLACAIAGLLLVVGTTATVLLTPGSSLAGGVLLAVATVLVIPGVFAAVAHGLAAASELVRNSALVLAIRELRTISLPVVALAAVGAVAVYGSIAVDGARRDLVAGLDSNFDEFLSTADVWVTTGGNDLTTNSFRPGGLQSRLARLPAVSAVRAYRGGLMDVGTRRMWIAARPAADRSIFPASQLLSGSLSAAYKQIRAGGAAAVSIGFAAEHRLRVGDTFSLPSPSGVHPFKVAAIITNVGWPPGAIFLNARDYSRDWESSEPTALEVDFKPGVTPAAGKREVDRLLAGRPGLGLQTRGEREALYKADSRQGVTALSQISILLLIAAGLAVASALSATIWRRRPELAALKVQGYGRAQLWRALLCESAIVLGFGCAVGALFGAYGHVLATRWLRLTTGFEARFSLGTPHMLTDVLLVGGIGLLIVALPGLAAARVSPRLALHE